MIRRLEASPHAPAATIQRTPQEQDKLLKLLLVTAALLAIARREGPR